MSTKFLREHADSLSERAKETAERARATPDDFFLQIAAKNQDQFAHSVKHQLSIEEAEEAP